MSLAMSDEFTSFDQQAVIKVCGVGGGGGNAVNRMISDGLQDVHFININTDAQALKDSPAPTRLQIGAEATGGLGSGAVPDIGSKAAQEDLERIAEVLTGANMVFLTAGLGGGTGTGASPFIADIARATGALTVAIVTLPFGFEGPERMKNAMKGLDELEPHVDTLIVIPNDRVATLSQHNLSFMDAFRHADEVLHNGVRAISELITVPGLINLDFADVRTIMQARGRALMGIGRADGEDRASRAAQEAIVCPLLEQSDITGARSVIVNIKGGRDIGMREVEEAVSTVQNSAHPDANIIFGAVVADDDSPELQVTVIAAGFPKVNAQGVAPEAQDKAAADVQQSVLAKKVKTMQEDRDAALERAAQKMEPAVAAENVEPFPVKTEEDAASQADLFDANEEASAKDKPAAEVDEDFDLPTYQRNDDKDGGKARPDWMHRRRA
jgi:cell division protein FtsZ